MYAVEDAVPHQISPSLGDKKEKHPVLKEVSIGVNKKRDINQLRSKEVKPINLDDILVNEVGQFGRFQAKSILLVAFVIVTTAAFGDFVFTAAGALHRCKIPECGETSKNETFAPPWLHKAIPVVPGGGFSKCERFAPVLLNGTSGSCQAELFDSTTLVPCDSFVYSEYNTVVYDFDLGCREWLRVLYGTVVSAGALIAFPISGFISDKFGRRLLLVISGVNTAIFGILRAFSVNYPMALTVQFLWAIFGAGTYCAAYIFATEMVGPKYRVVTSATSASLFALGEVLVGGVAWMVHPWRYLVFALCAPSFLIIAYLWLLPESVRWLLSKHKYAEAKEILEKVAEVNGKQISEKTLKALMNPPTELKKIVQNQKEPGLVSKIFKSSILLRRVCTTPIWWMVTTFVYYGLSINSVGLSDTIYLNYILTCLVEIPGYFTAAFLLYRIGRRSTLFCGYLLTAICNLAFVFLSKELQTVRLVLFLLGKFSISGVMTSVYLFTSELYPTEYRHSLVAFSSMVGRVGSLAAPLTPLLLKYWAGLPSVLFSCMGLLAGALVLTQPETVGTKLPDTLAEAEALGQPQSKLKFNEQAEIN